MADSQDLWLLPVGIDNNPWSQYQPLIPRTVGSSSSGFEPFGLVFKNFIFKFLIVYPTNF
jgi:hypothetical protein